jgi:hypothetical protein
LHSLRNAPCPTRNPSSTTPPLRTAVQAGESQPYESIEGNDEEWEEESEELPRRARCRLLTPIPLALVAALLIACGFVAGVKVQKGQTRSASGAGAGLASRLAALGGGAPSAGTAGHGRSAAGPGSTGGSGAFPGAGGLGGGVTTGEVSYVRGTTLYVANAQANTVKVSTTAGSKITKTVTTKTNAIRPGDTVVVLGSQAKDGTTSASSISISTNGSGNSTGSGSSGGGAATLFGSG